MAFFKTEFFFFVSLKNSHLFLLKNHAKLKYMNQFGQCLILVAVNDKCSEKFTVQYF
jgi:hypothetical protein